MSARTGAGSAAPASRFWAPVAVIGSAQFLVIMNNAIINVALPSLVSDLGIGPSDQSWVVTVYLLAFGALLLLGGRVGDALGHRNVFVAGLAVTALAAIGSGLATSGSAYLLWRAAQGAAAAFVSPSAVALLSTAFVDPVSRAKAFGVYGAVTGAGGGAGLLLGGLLTDAWSWRWAMFASVPIAVVAIGGAFLALPASSTARRRSTGPIRPLAALLVVLAVGALLVTITRAGTGASAWSTLASLAVAGASAGGFLLAERRTEHPLVPPGVLASRDRLLGLLTVGTGALGLTGVFVVLSQQMQQEGGMTPMEAALAVLPYPVGMVFSTQLAPRLIARFGARRVAVAGLLASAVGIVPLASAGGAPYAVLTLPSLLFVSATIGPAFVSGTQLAMSGIGEEEAGVAGSLLNSASEIGGAVGVAVMSAVGVAVAVTRDGGEPAYAAEMYAAAALLVVGSVMGAVVCRRRAPDGAVACRAAGRRVSEVHEPAAATHAE
ncbi:MFS transporter [Oerskovia rustica]|uniref:MFS transporter n=1 Tax=Oerskovia rustica TaxID=2762237 RepID=A0ABR8RVD3_9CELL|nr:MFS transporter [Oerskovia rustica]MBD7951750.1 MFS transporter [Oerskovia rustica]